MKRNRFMRFQSLTTLAHSYISKVSRISNAHLVQNNKKIQQFGDQGCVEEARNLFDKMSQRDAVSWNSMISVYIQQNRIQEARALFDSFEGRNVRTWTILLSGYAKAGLVEDARRVFLAMPERNVVSWNAMLSCYLQNGDVRSGRKVFDEMPERNVSSWNSMITGYCRLGMVREARELFGIMGERNSVTWLVMISGYVDGSQYREGWGLFLMMMRWGIRPDQAIMVVGVSVTMGLDNLYLLESFRALAIKLNYEDDMVVGSAILNAYTRCERVDYAVKFFEAMPVRNEYSWTCMIAAFARCGRLNDAVSFYERSSCKSVEIRTTVISAYMQNGRVDDALQMFDETVNPNVITWNAMIAGYAQNGMLEEAKDMFSKMPLKNGASWAALISGFVHNGCSKTALDLFSELHRTGITPSHSSFTSVLSACANIENIEIGRQIHSLTIKRSSQHNLFVGNGLISMYAKCNSIDDFSQAFSTMRVRDTITWNALISGFLDNGMMNEARNAFEMSPMQNVVSCTLMISAYVQAGQGESAFNLFMDMMSEGLKPNDLTVIILLRACGCIGLTRLGEQIHAFSSKLGFDLCLCVSNSLISMYFNCGSLDGLRVFAKTPDRDIGTWNAVLTGCVQNGIPKEAINIFKQMEAAGVLPNEISFSSVLRASSHAGLVDEGWNYFISMSQDYEIIPTIYHYTCMVDLLGRAGQLSEAEALINNMHVEADRVIWETLLTACRIHRDTRLGLKVAGRLLEMGIQTSEFHIFLLNMYASLGMRDFVEEIKKSMNFSEVKEEPGVSWIQIKDKLHSFITEEKEHDEIKGILLVLKELYGSFEVSSCVPDTNLVVNYDGG